MQGDESVVRIPGLRLVAVAGLLAAFAGCEPAAEAAAPFEVYWTENRFYHDGDHPSRVNLPVVPARSR